MRLTHQGCSIFAVGSINGSDIVAFAIKKRVIVVQVVGDSYTPLREFAAPSTPTLVTVVLGSVAIAHDRTFTVFDWESLRPQVRPLVSWLSPCPLHLAQCSLTILASFHLLVTALLFFYTLLSALS